MSLSTVSSSEVPDAIISMVSRTPPGALVGRPIVKGKWTCYSVQWSNLVRVGG